MSKAIFQIALLFEKNFQFRGSNGRVRHFSKLGIASGKTQIADGLKARQGPVDEILESTQPLRLAHEERARVLGLRPSERVR